MYVQVSSPRKLQLEKLRGGRNLAVGHQNVFRLARLVNSVEIEVHLLNGSDCSSGRRNNQNKNDKAESFKSTSARKNRFLECLPGREAGRAIS